MTWRRGVFLGGVLVVVGAAGAQEFSAPLASTAPVIEENAVLVSTETEGGLSDPEKPGWLIRAERAFEEGVLAETAGNARLARKKYGRALKIFADEADEGRVLALRPEMSSFLRRAGQLSGSRADSPGMAELLPGMDAWNSAEGQSVNTVDPQIRSPSSAVQASTHSYTILVDGNDPLVKQYVALYTGPLRERTQAAFDRMGRYQEMVSRAIAEEGLPRELIYLPVVESEYQTFAVSRAGAVGMWQFMSATAKYAGLKVNYWVDERRDPEKSTRAALRTLKSLYDWFDDWHLALAAYNRGIYGIQRDLEFTRSPDFTLLSKRQGVPLETEQYVPKLMALVLIGDNAAAHGLRPPQPHPLPPPDTAVLQRPLDLKIAAACAGVTESTIRELNPSLRLWVTPANEPNFQLRIPAGSKERFLAELAKVKEWTPSPGFVRYTVQRGDILGRIAARYRTTAGAIQRENKLPNSNRLRPGQTLIIRPGRGFKGESLP